MAGGCSVAVQWRWGIVFKLNVNLDGLRVALPRRRNEGRFLASKIRTLFLRSRLRATHAFFSREEVLVWKDSRFFFEKHEFSD